MTFELAALICLTLVLLVIIGAIKWLLSLPGPYSE